MQHNSSAQVWVSFFKLSLEYWRPRFLFPIANCGGTPICIDASTSKSRVDRTFGPFVRVLIDMDLTLPINYNVLVEQEGFAFFADIEYENILVLCSHCKKTGHEVQECIFLKKTITNTIPKGLHVPKVTNAPISSLVVVEDAEDNANGGNNRRDINTDKEVELEANSVQLVENGLVVHKPLNFVSQVSKRSDTQ